MACNIVAAWALNILARMPEKEFDAAVRAGHITFLERLLDRDLISDAATRREKLVTHRPPSAS